MASKIGRLNPSKTILLLCDLQEKFAPTISHFDQILETSVRMFDACKLLEVPYVVTEHYPKGLGRTVPDIMNKVQDKGNVFEKTKFSMCTSNLLEHIKKKCPDYESLMICGIEAHACVLSTCLDFLELNKDVHVIVDAVSSRNMVDRKYAFDRMRKSGAFLTTYESAMFQLIKDAKHPKFKDIQKLIKTPAPDSKLLQI